MTINLSHKVKEIHNKITVKNQNLFNRKW